MDRKTEIILGRGIIQVIQANQDEIQESQKNLIQKQEALWENQATIVALLDEVSTRIISIENKLGENESGTDENIDKGKEVTIKVQSGGSRISKDNLKENYKCFTCGKIGHISRNCHVKKEESRYGSKRLAGKVHDKQLSYNRNGENNSSLTRRTASSEKEYSESEAYAEY